MNVPTLQMDPDEALGKAFEYEASSRRDPETLLAKKIFQLLAEDKVLVDVGMAIRDAGFHGDEWRPKLALARADRRHVAFRWYSWSDIGLFDSNVTRGRHFPALVEAVNFNRLHNLRYRDGDGSWHRRTVDGYALVPMVPPDVSYGGYKPHKCHILWEVEKWSDSPLRAMPDRDPYLLHRIEGDLFEVLGEWDLTEVERYVMAGRARVRQ